MNTGALNNIKVLDLTRVLAGPFSTMMLADMGAEIIKIEMPNTGDDTRTFGPFKNNDSMYFASINRNKKGITLNLKSEEGKAMFREMVKTADIVVENYRPGVMEKLGLGYEELKKINDKIIYGAVSGFGCYGDYSQRAGYDIIAQAMGGLMSVTGAEGGDPTRTGNAMGDVLGGLHLTIGLLAAINARNLTGKGQRVDIALLDGVISAMETGFQNYFATGNNVVPSGNRYASAYPYDSFKTSDGGFVLGCGNDKLFAEICEKVMEMPELATDPRFMKNVDRCKNHKELKAIMEAWSTKYTLDEALEIMNKHGIPAAPIFGMDRVVADPHVKQREMFIPLEHPTIGEMTVTGCPIKLMDTKPEIKTPAPLLGEHNEEVYKELLGIDSEKLKMLRENGVI